ncbi:MAG: hypothetical protein ACRCX8_11350 [Sarcina sp.]
MIDNDLETEENSLYEDVENSAKKSFEEYYYAFFFLSVFVVGAFALYISTGVSRGIFILIDLFLIYKMLKSLWELHKNKRREHLALRYQLKFLNRIYFWACIALCEAITRHYLELNITILDYLEIMAVVYALAYIIYNALKYYMKRLYMKTLETGSYQKIVAWKSIKHKGFVILSFFMVIVLVVPNVMDLLKSQIYLVLMTIVYAILLIVTLEIKCDLELEEKLLFKEGYFDFSNIKNSKKEEVSIDFEDEDEDYEAEDEEYEDKDWDEIKKDEEADDLDEFVAQIKAEEEEKLRQKSREASNKDTVDIDKAVEDFFFEDNIKEKTIDNE